jgi:Tol biopolymer transport system component
VTDNLDDWDPAWSPNAKRFVYHGSDGVDYEIYTLLPDGSGIKRPTNNDQNDVEPDWQPR